MRRWKLVAVAIAVLAIATVVVLPRLMRDPEVSNPGELRDGEPEALAIPAFVTSDPRLEQRGAHSFQERMVEQGTDAGLEGAPYFFEFSDGRFAFGYTDAAGFTRKLYADAPVDYKILWYDDALSRLKEKHSRPGR